MSKGLLRETILCLLMVFCSPVVMAQRLGNDALSRAVRAFFEAYVPENYQPARPMQAEGVVRDGRSRRVTVTANESFCSQAFTPEKVKEIYRRLGQALPPPYNAYRLSIRNRQGVSIEELVPNDLRDGADRSRLWGDMDFDGNPWVTNLSRPYDVPHGLTGRHVMVNASHGRYYGDGKWQWQRPNLFCTTEDFFTQSFVFPLLIPMLENAGAVVATSRERDVQTAEALVDNDDTLQLRGAYTEVGAEDFDWQTTEGATGFAPTGGVLSDSVRPFTLGTVRQVNATSRTSRLASATWMPRIPRRGRYAVYVSYATLPGSVSDARYTVYHLGGRTQFRVNQQMGGGTWVYLGTFEFDEGERREGRVVLTNRSDYRGVVTADAVRFGGGMGQTERGLAGVSGLPRYLEAARYHARWSGLPDSLCRRGNGQSDYSDDIRVRGHYVNHMAGGSVYLPGLPGKGVPFEALLAVHSDAGAKRDSIYGSLAISTTKGDRGVRFPSGVSRKASADLASALLTDMTADLSRTFNTKWTRRELWDRNYGETRVPEVPAAIIEILSHQNYTDLKYGHDPHFKFTLARSLYKSVLRFVNYQHGIKDYEVQPLPPTNFAVELTADGRARLSWQAAVDSLCPEARPTAYVVYSRVEGAAFDNGQLVKGPHTSLTLPLSAGEQYSFKVTAVNGGGESFPSEVLTVHRGAPEAKRLLIVNGFERLSGPAWVDTADSIGFDLTKDVGVPYHYTNSLVGYQTDFNPAHIGKEGFGALGFCGDELTGRQIAGNTFDFPVLHGKAIAPAGYNIASCSRAALLSGAVRLEDYDAVDYICGLECDAPYNMRPYKTFDVRTRQLLADYLKQGGRLWVSGSYIASDMAGSKEERDFIREVLKYDCGGTAQADSTDYVQGLNITLPYRRSFSEEGYAVQRPDVLVPADKNAFTAFAYGGGKSAGIAYAGQDCRIIAMGFPFESITDEKVRRQAAAAILQFLTE